MMAVKQPPETRELTPALAMLFAQYRTERNDFARKSGFFGSEYSHLMAQLLESLGYGAKYAFDPAVRLWRKCDMQITNDADPKAPHGLDTSGGSEA
jgi:hypothetical protein